MKFSTFKMAWESTSKVERKKGSLITMIIRLTSTKEKEISVKIKNLNLKSGKSIDKETAYRNLNTKKGKYTSEKKKQKFLYNYCHEKIH